MKNKKLLISIIFSTVFILVMVFSVIIPTFSRFQNGLDDPEWDGIVATSFNSGTGTQEDPYIISTPNELAYFALSMENDNYEGKYIKLIKDIVINKGVFKNNTYMYNDKEYYLNNNGKYYLDKDFNTEINNVNIMPTINGFKGSFNGDFHTIYGLYENNNDKNALFTDFSGELSNLYIDNAYIIGGSITGGVIADSNNATIKNVVFNGKIQGNIEENITSGIIAQANNTEVDGVVNKGNISGLYTSGLIGTSTNTNIKNSYNIGKITGERSSGIIDTIIDSNSSISNVYNTGETQIGLISKIENSTISVDKVFNTYETSMLKDIVSSTLEITNSYNAIPDDNFRSINIETIKELYPTYDSNSIANGNIWIKEELPILYFDDLKNRTVQVKIGNYTWDKFNNNYENVKFDEEVEVLITTTDMYKPIKNVWYYKSNEMIEKKDLESLEWIEYNGIFSLNDNVYILYIKYEDYNDNTYYINTDKLIVGTITSNVSINSGKTRWTTLTTPKNNFINKEPSYEISTNGSSLSISKLEYIISTSIIEEKDLETVGWNTYTDIIKPTEDMYIIYAKVTDINSNITYINTDKMINMSYTIKDLKRGNNLEYSNDMTYDSSFNFNVELKHIIKISDYNRYIKVNKMLPINTKITIKDKNNKYYEYITTTQDKDNELDCYLYPLSQFKEAGKITFAEYFKDSNYNNLDKEEFNIYIDFSNTNKTIDKYDLSLIAKNKEIVNSKEDIQFNLVDKNNDLSINTNFNDTINYGTLNTYSIDLNTSLNNVLNTNYENLYEGISIEVLDKENNVVSRDKLKDLRFKYNNSIYVLDRNNKININLGKTHNNNITLQVLTYDGNTNINDTYKISIKGYLSIDGTNTKYLSKNDISIPLVLKNNNLDYNFDVKLNGPIINKGGKFSFNISYEGKLSNPRLKVFLYKKKELTAYNQEYELVDLNNYISNKLDPNNIPLENIVFNIKNNVESNGYKFIFELYDNEDKITEIDIKTIIR